MEPVGKGLGLNDTEQYAGNYTKLISTMDIANEEMSSDRNVKSHSIALVTVVENSIYTNAFEVFNKDITMRKMLNKDTDLMEQIKFAFFGNLLTKLKEFNIVLVTNWTEQLANGKTLLENLVEQYDVGYNIIFLGSKHRGLTSEIVAKSEVTEGDNSNVIMYSDMVLSDVIRCYNRDIDKHRLNTELLLHIMKSRNMIDRDLDSVTLNCETLYNRELGTLLSKITDSIEKEKARQNLQDYKEFIGEQRITKLYHRVYNLRQNMDIESVKHYIDFFNNAQAILLYNGAYGVKYKEIEEKRGVEFPIALMHQCLNVNSENLLTGYNIIHIKFLGLHCGGVDNALSKSNLTKDMLVYTKSGDSSDTGLKEMRRLLRKVDIVDPESKEVETVLSRMCDLCIALYKNNMYVSELNRNNMKIVVSSNCNKDTLVKLINTELSKVNLECCVYSEHVITDNIPRKWFIEYNDNSVVIE